MLDAHDIRVVELSEYMHFALEAEVIFGSTEGTVAHHFDSHRTSGRAMSGAKDDALAAAVNFAYDFVVGPKMGNIDG